MPTPLEILLDPISLIVLSMYGALMLWETVLPGRKLPKVPGWRLRGLASFTSYFFLSSYLPLLWDGWLAAHRLLDSSVLGTFGGTVVGLLVYETGAWFWHRAMHRFEPLWRMHQTHHSAERLDSFGAFWFHPLDMVGWTALASVSLVLLVGVTPAAATNILLITTWMAVFQHTNVKTPRWLGYLVQRPESHTVHHARWMHRSNYSDLPFVDIVFGTFENPKGYEHETGLYPGASSRLWDLLTLRDVSAAKTARDAAASESSKLVDSVA
jgi:sterol desaturase/sphingolipid hydroxylase (fatty acid hydroxylase superfamily)